MWLKNKYRTKVLRVGCSKYVRVPPSWAPGEEVTVFEGDDLLLISKRDSESYFVMSEENFEWLRNELQSEIDKATVLDAAEAKRAIEGGPIVGTYYGGYRDGIIEAFELLKAAFEVWFDRGFHLRRGPKNGE